MRKETRKELDKLLALVEGLKVPIDYAEMGRAQGQAAVVKIMLEVYEKAEENLMESQVASLWSAVDRAEAKARNLGADGSGMAFGALTGGESQEDRGALADMEHAGVSEEHEIGE